MAGVNIGNRCLVAANSVVTKNVPGRTIVGGAPARSSRRSSPVPVPAGLVVVLIGPVLPPAAS